MRRYQNFHVKIQRHVTFLPLYVVMHGQRSEVDSTSREVNASTTVQAIFGDRSIQIVIQRKGCLDSLDIPVQTLQRLAICPRQKLSVPTWKLRNFGIDENRRGKKIRQQIGVDEIFSCYYKVSETSLRNSPISLYIFHKRRCF